MTVPGARADSAQPAQDEMTDNLYEMYLRCGGRVSTDSRSITGGEMFFALKGDNFDGNSFARAALDNGAACAVVTTGSDIARSGDHRVIAVPDTLAALSGLALRHRLTFKFPVIALTGTSGKTTTKELIHSVLSTRLRTAATRGNLNNDIGVPLTLLGIRPEETDIAVIEMGASHPDDISRLSEVVRPDFGLITNIGKAHLQGFGGIGGVRAAKGQLYDWLSSHGGTAFVNTADNTLQSMAAEREGMRVIPYVQGAKALKPTSERPCLTMEIEGYGILPTHLAGSYNVPNVLAALTVGMHFGITLDKAAEAVSGYIPDGNRSQIVECGSNRLILDCYNANPNSMDAALDNFASMEAPRKVALLGDMLELGADSLREHMAVARKAMAGDYSAYFVGGEFASALSAISGVPDLESNGTSLSPRTFPDADALAAYLKNHPPRGCTILIKGSHGMRMDRVIPALDQP